SQAGAAYDQRHRGEASECGTSCNERSRDQEDCKKRQGGNCEVNREGDKTYVTLHKTQIDEARNTRDDGLNVAVLPALPLTDPSFRRCWKVADHYCRRTKCCRAPGQCELQAELHVLDDMATGQLGGTDHGPRERHAGPHQLAGKIESLQSKRTDPILHA